MAGKETGVAPDGKADGNLRNDVNIRCESRVEIDLRGRELYKLAPGPPDRVRLPFTTLFTPSDGGSPQTRFPRYRSRHHIQSILSRSIRHDPTRKGPPPTDLEVIRDGAGFDSHGMLNGRKWRKWWSVDRFARGRRSRRRMNGVGSRAGEELGRRRRDSG